MPGGSYDEGEVDAAADAVQDAFVQLCLHWDRVTEYDDPAAWVRRVAEVARSMGISKGAVDRHLHRARTALRPTLEASR